MSGNEKPDSAPGGAARSDRLSRYRVVLDAYIKRNHLEDKALAAELNMDRSYFSKMRRGQRPITPKIVDHLVDRFELDRVRLALAVDMMDDPLSYFDPDFTNLCRYVQVVMSEMAKSPDGEKQEFHLGTLSPDRCEALAQAAVDQLRDQFAALSEVPITAKPRRAA